MANGSDIVQTIKIEVEGAEEAAAEIKKVGDATEEVQQTAASSAGGTQELGKGLDEVSGKSSLTRGEMRALGSVMRQLGAGEAAGLALQFNKMRGAFGTVGVAVLGAAMAFSALMKSVKEAKEASDSVERLSKSLSDTPARLQAMQSAFKSAGVSFADFEKGLDALAFKVIERSADMAEAAAQSSKKVIDAELAAAQAAQAASPNPQLFDAQIKRLQVSQKQEAAYLAEEQAAKAYANSQAALVPQLEKAAQGQKTVLDPAVKTESIMDSLAQMFAKTGQNAASFGDDLEKGVPSALKMADAINTMFNSFDPISQAKLKTGLKGWGIPESFVNQITTTTEKYEKLKKAADEAAKFNASEAGKSLAQFNEAVVESQKMVEGWGQSLKIFFAELVTGVKTEGIGFLGRHLMGGLAEAGRNIMAALASIGSSIKQAVVGWVTTSVPGAWQWIVNTAASVWEQVKTLAGQAKDAVVQFVTTAPGAAWQWIADTAVSVWEQVKTLAGQAKDAVVRFVTTAPGAAWQWIVDTAASVWEQVKTLAGQAKDAVVSFVTTPVANAWAWIVDKWNAMLAQLGRGGAAGTPTPAAVPGAARGGLLGGRGTGTSDSNLAWVSRGEHIMPAQAVSQPGVLAFLEALRRSGGNLRDILDGMRGFALGGMVAPTLSIPAFAGGGMGRDLGTLHLALPSGQTFAVRASSAVVDELRKAAAMAQVRSGGRKPSRYS